MSENSVNHGVVIVGGGVIGVACAHYLRRSGLEVALIDRGDFGQACSYGNCGYICPSHILPLTEPAALRVALKSVLNPLSPLYVKPRMSPALWRWMFEFARRCTHRQMLTAGGHLHAILQSSMKEYLELHDEGQVDCDWTPRGLLYVMRSKSGMEEFAETDRLLSEHFGVTARRLDGDELTSFDSAIKSGLAGGFLYEADAHLRPDALVESWTQRLQSKEVRLLRHCELRDIEIDGGRVVALKTSKGVMRPEVVVIATGAWSPRLGRMLGCAIPIEPGKGYSLTTTRPDPCPRQAILFPENRVGVTPFQDGYRLGSMMEFVGYDETIPERRIQQLRDAATDYLVAPYTERELGRWYGWRPMTWDSLPIIGPAPGLTNAYLATGHNMLGMSMATATGRLIAELITRQPLHLDITPFSAHRFN